ncbi:MAG: choice-of-anchor J domain-containing protein, partial [Candidatus Delongbacteria bacterium]|nr:choice-of-anchor J domain-containing protein [Candidatus Delongbacteria bacterium]
MFENIWGDYDHGSLHIAFGSTNNNDWSSMNSNGWRTVFTPNLTYYVSIASELGSLYSGFGNGYVPYNIVVGPGYQAYMVGNTFTAESQMTVHIDAALANFAFYPQNIPENVDMYYNEQQIIDLSNVFYNESGSGITYEVFSNSDDQAITATIDGSNLILDSHDKMAITDITIRGTVPANESFFKFQIETFDQTLFENLNESFEDNFEPMGWTLQTTGAGWMQTSDAHSGSFAAVHFYDAGTQDDWLYTPKMMITGNAVLTFWEKTKYSLDGVHSIGVSTDLVRYDRIAYNLPHTANWQQTYIDLSAYDGQEIYIGFNYMGDDSDIWYVDDVRLWTTTGIM